MIDYTGIKDVCLSDEMLAQFYQNQVNSDDLVENQYLNIRNAFNEPLETYVKRNKVLMKVNYPVIESNFMGLLKPRNPEQYCAFDLINNDNIPIKVLTSKFGCGKTLIMVAGMLQKLEQGKFDKIIYIRNNISVRNTEPIGHLPGTLLEKLIDWAMPFADHVGGIDGLKTLIDKGSFEVVPLNMLRGRSFRNSIIYSTEAENLTKEHIQLLMGRVDENSQLWIEGDTKQRDKDVFEKSHGLELMIERLKGIPEFGYVRLEKSERGKVAALADRLD